MLELIKRFGLPDSVSALVESNLIAATVILAVLGIVFAFWGYKFVKIILIVGSTTGAAIATDLFLVPLFADKVANVSFFSITGIVITVAGLIAALIAYKWPRIIIFLGAAAGGYFFAGPLVSALLAGYFPSAAFFSSKVGVIVVSAVIALLAAIIASVLFKFLFILATSFAGAAITTVALFSLIFADGVLVMFIPAIVVIVALAIVAIVCQYVRGKKYQPVYY